MLRQSAGKGKPARAYVSLNGERHYLGHHGTPEAEEAYHRALAEWIARGRRPAPPKPQEATLTECADVFLDHLAERYRSHPRSRDRAKYAIEALIPLYGRMPASQFDASHLRTIREGMIAAGLARTVINSRIREIVRMLKFCVSVGMCPPDAHAKARTLEPLQRGRSAAREMEPVRPVPRADVDAVLAHVNRSVAAMIRLQLLTGARPGEVCGLRREDIDTSGAVWIAELKDHKNKWRGNTRALYFGPNAQRILKEFFVMRRPGEYLFQPRDHFREIHEAARRPRRPNQKATPTLTDRTVGDRYEPGAYANAIKRACKAAGVTRWTPHRLRHTAATELRKEYGVEVARAVLGHACLAATEIYAEADMTVVTRVMGEKG